MTVFKDTVDKNYNKDFFFSSPFQSRYRFTWSTRKLDVQGTPATVFTGSGCIQ